MPLETPPFISPLGANGDSDLTNLQPQAAETVNY
jgi:hypothetical protein